MKDIPANITDKDIQNFIKAALKEDVGTGDHTSMATIPVKKTSKAVLKVKDYGVLAGIELAKRVFHQVDKKIEFIQLKGDGDDAFMGDIAFELKGNSRSILKGERLALNAMQRMSGIATLSSRFAFEVADLPVKVLDTRKTTPLIRFLEKWAVHIGGCQNYRWGLYDWIMIKDNHVEAAGGVEAALHNVHKYLERKGLDLGITLEVRNLIELEEALQVGGFTRVMLDNFEIPILTEAVGIVNKRFETEASGGINLQTVRAYAKTGVDYVSAGALTHSAMPLDLSLKIVE